MPFGSERIRVHTQATGGNAIERSSAGSKQKGNFMEEITKTYKGYIKSHWSDRFIKTNATMLIKQEFKAKKAKCISFKRIDENTQEFTYQITR